MKLENMIDRYCSLYEVFEERRKSYEESRDCLVKLFGQIVSRLRYEGKTKQGEIARSLGISRPYLSRLESGERPVLAKHFAKMAKLLTNMNKGDAEPSKTRQDEAQKTPEEQQEHKTKTQSDESDSHSRWLYKNTVQAKLKSDDVEDSYRSLDETNLTPGGNTQGGFIMQCSKCQFENPEGMEFCGRCGSKLQNLCPSCKFDNPPEFQFCGKCGARLTKGAPLNIKQNGSPTGSMTIPLGIPLSEVEKLIIAKTLEINEGNKELTAQILGLSRRTIYRKSDSIKHRT